MRLGEIVGVAALVGVAVLVGIALTDDTAPETITTDTSPFVFDAATTTITTTTAAPAPESTSPDTKAATSTTARRRRSTTTTTTAARRSSSSAPTTTVAPTTTLIPPESRATIPVRVLNGGAPPGSATFVSGALREAGFDPPSAADASMLVDATTVLYAPGGEVAALTVNEVVGADADNIVAASDDDPNWAEFGADLTVLVVLGPAPA